MNLSLVRPSPVAAHSVTQPLALAVLGNVLVGLLLLGGLLLAPALVSAWLLF